jgi:hypothetical protein
LFGKKKKLLGGKPVDASNFIEYKYAGNLPVPGAVFFSFFLFFFLCNKKLRPLIFEDPNFSKRN